jgi:hypothetical protein
MATDNEKSHLKVVGGDGVVPHDGKEPYAKLRREVLDLKETIDQSRWRLAEKLFEVHDGTIFHRWGYNNFEQYMETEVKMKERTGQYLVSMYNWFVNEIGPQMEDAARDKMIEGVRQLGWTKARCLIGITTPDNVFKWIEDAQRLSSTELQSAARKALVEKKGGKSKDVEDMKTLSLRLADSQHAIVLQAIELAGKIADSDKKGHLISLICQDFVANTRAQDNAGQKNRGKYFNRIGAMFGVKLIAVDTETGKVVHNEAVLKKIKD